MVYKRQLFFQYSRPSGCDTSKLLSDGLKNKLYYDGFQKMLYHYSHHSKKSVSTNYERRYALFIRFIMSLHVQACCFSRRKTVVNAFIFSRCRKSVVKNSPIAPCPNPCSNMPICACMRSLSADFRRRVYTHSLPLAAAPEQPAADDLQPFEVGFPEHPNAAGGTLHKGK